MPFPDPAAGGAAPVVSREKERLILPPRVSMPVPGMRGPGLLAGLRENPGGGCFLLLFMGIGLAIFLFGLAGTVGPWKEGLRENGDPRFFLAAMGFGTVFFLVALRMFQIAMTGEGHRVRHQSARGAKDRPWEWDHPWRPAGMAPDYTGSAAGSILGRVAFLALLGLFNIALAAPSWFLKGIVLFFDLFGLLILYDSLQQLWQWARFRRPTVAWTTFPAFLGGSLKASVRFPRALRPAGPPRATLRCVEDQWTTSTSPKGTQRQLEPHALYREARELPLPVSEGEALHQLDVTFELPAEVPGTDLGREEAVYWQLVLEVPIAGPDFSTIFLAPVYRR